MTKQERLQPKTINGQRRARIAKGSGTSVQEVNVLMKQWGEMNRIMSKMRSTMAQPMGKHGKKNKKSKKRRSPMSAMNSMLGGLTGGMPGSMDPQMMREFERMMKNSK